ncbi:hypothetical protein NX869_22860 [Burkholderia thailandensis]|nr:hypothetical protein [Burkholderia thailandensis]
MSQPTRRPDRARGLGNSSWRTSLWMTAGDRETAADTDAMSRYMGFIATVKRDSTASPIDLLSGIANRLTATVESIREIAVEIETAALVIEEQQAANGREADKLRQLQALLKTL